MFEVNVFSITREMAWVSILLYTFALVYTLLFYKRWPNQINGKGRDFFWALFFSVFAVTYAIDADFFHYKEIVYSTWEVLPYGLEQVYQYLILFINNNYLLFRIIVFGGSVFVYFCLLGRVKCDRTIGILLMLIVFGGYFSYARASLAFSLYYLGLSYLLLIGNRQGREQSGLLARLFFIAIGLALIISSFFFHRSMLILIALTPMALLRFEKRSVFFIALLSPLILMVLRSSLEGVFDLLAFDSIIENRVTEVYAEASGARVNWKGAIANTINYGKYVLCFILISSSIFKNRSSVDIWVKHLFSYYTSLSYLALLCYPLFEGNIIYTNRFLKMTIVPIMLIISYLYKNKYFPIVYMQLVLLLSVFSGFLRIARFIF